MSEPAQANMAQTRALITDLEREQIAGEHGDERRYQAVTRVRSRVQDRLVDDIALLEKHHPDLLSEVRTVVCND